MECVFAYFQPQLMLGNAKHDIKTIIGKLITAIYIYYLIYITNISCFPNWELFYLTQLTELHPEDAEFK